MVTHICIKCRTGVRRSEGDGYKCSSCGGNVFSISTKFRIPKKKDVKGWKKFIQWLKDYNGHYNQALEEIENGFKNVT